MKDIFVFGIGHHPNAVIDVAIQTGNFKIRGIVREDPETRTFNAECLNWAQLRESDVRAGVVAYNDNFMRARKVAEILREFPDFEFVTLVHPSAQIGEDVEIGPGSVIMPGAIINVGSQVSAHVIVNTRASIDHESRVGDYASLAPAATLCGLVEVGESTAIGPGATVIHRVKIGAHTVIGAGTVVVRDIPSHVVAYGNPCRAVRSRAEGARYL